MSALMPKLMPKLQPPVAVAEEMVQTGIPRAYLLSLISGGVDTVGLSVDDYDSLDTYWQSVFFSDSSTPLDVAWDDIVNDPNTNTQGGQVFYSADRDIIVIYSSSPEESAERKLWKYMFDTQFSVVQIDGVDLQIDGQQLYIEV